MLTFNLCYGLSYVVQRCLYQEEIRDEILVMIVNQTWLNPNDINQERGWVLLSLCLGCFAPSEKLYPYLLCHVTAHAYEKYKGYCQAKLLMSYERQARQFPPSLLEWECASTCSPMAISVQMFDGVTKVSSNFSIYSGFEYSINSSMYKKSS